MSLAPDPLDHIALLAKSSRVELCGLARSEGLRAEDAVDVVQEAVCTLLGKARDDTLPADSAEWGPLLAGIVRNTARNRRRLHAVARPHETLDDLDLAARSPLADDLLARAEEHVRLRACVAELCDVQRAVVTLRMLEELPGEDVGRALGISSNHVAVLLLRAKSALRACLVG